MSCGCTDLQNYNNMKKIIAISVFVIGASMSSIGQTNRVSHFSHSGNIATLDIFKSADNMGCGHGQMEEFVPDTTVKVSPDSTKIKTKMEKQKPTKPVPVKETPRRGMSLESKFDVESVLGKFK